MDDWLAVLALDTVESVSSRSRSRSRSRSSSYRSIRPPSPDEESSDVDGETELQGIFHEESPPSVSDVYIRSQKAGDLPLFFRHRNVCVSQTLMQTICDCCGDAFYIGATINPRTRWLGRPGMPGHCLYWDMMIVIAFTSQGRRIETSAIRFAQTMYGRRCTNKKADSRGQASGRDNFIYICC